MNKLLAVTLFALSTTSFAQSTITTTTIERRQYQTKTTRDGGLRETEMELLRQNDPKSSVNDLYRAKRDLDRVLRLNESPTTRTETRIERDVE